MKLKPEQKVKVLKELESIPVKDGRVKWELVIQDHILLGINQEGGIERKKIV